MSAPTHHSFRGRKGGTCQFLREAADEYVAAQLCEAGEQAKVHMGYAPDYIPTLGDKLTSAGEEAIKAMIWPVAEAPPKEQFWPGSAEAVWQEYNRQVAELLTMKRAYGNAWQKQGYMGNLARIMSKTARLENLLWRDHSEPGNSTAASDAEDEMVLDTLRDLGALCAFMVSNIEMKNRWGS